MYNPIFQCTIYDAIKLILHEIYQPLLRFAGRNDIIHINLTAKYKFIFK